MNKHRLKSIALAAAVTVGVLASAPIHAASDEADAANAAPQPLPEPKIKVKDVINVGIKKNTAAAKSQARIDRLASQTNDLLQDYKTVMKQVDGLRVYNARLERQIENQLRRLADLEEGIGEATVIQRQVTPLVLRMLDGLEKFVELDVPFHKEERINRIEQEGVIKKKVALLDRHALGMDLVVFATINLTTSGRQNLEEFEQSVENFDEVMECYTMTGIWDYMLKIIVKDIRNYESFVRDRLLCLPMIREIHSHIAVTEIKNTTELPLKTQL